MQKTLWWAGVVLGVCGGLLVAYSLRTERRGAVRMGGYGLLVAALILAVLAAASSPKNEGGREGAVGVPVGAVPPPAAPLDARLRSPVPAGDDVVPSAAPTPTSSPPELLILSADSWCGFSKKMTAEVKRLQEMLAPAGVTVKLVSDSSDKQTFAALAQAHGAKGFPHSVVLRDGVPIGAVAGYQPAEQMKQSVLSKLS